MIPGEKQAAMEKSLVAETKFMEWLNARKIPYWYIRQDLQSFSPALKKVFGSKRPDFMVLIPHVGFMLVDVKNRDIKAPYNTVAINCEEMTSYSNLNRNFNLSVWFAVSNEMLGFKKWLWAPVSRFAGAQNLKRKQGQGRNSEFYGVPMSDFVEIGFQDHLGVLFAKCLEQGRLVN